MPQDETVAGQEVQRGGNDATPDELWMEEALRCAQRALEAGEVPVGAVVVCDGKVVGRGWNRNITDADPTAHAEVVALREAVPLWATIAWGSATCLLQLNRARCAPERWCMPAFKRLVYGADDPKAGAVHSVMQVLNHPQLNHKMEVRGGVLAGRSAELLQTFFRNRR